MPAAKPKTAPPEATPAAAPTHLVELSIPTPDGVKVADSMGIEAYAQEFTITSASDSVKAQEARARVNTRIKTLTEARMEQTRLLDVAKKGLIAWWGNLISPLERAKGVFDAKILDYDNQQEEIRKAEQRRLDKIAEDERKRLQAIADEAKRKADIEAERLRKEAAEKKAAGDREAAAKLEAKAAHVEAKADAKAEVFETRASSVVAPIAQADTARSAGTHIRETPQFEILDASKINPQFMMPDEVKIGRVVRSLGLAAADVVGGIKVTLKKGLASQRL